jgi:hypothetical protein
VAADGTESVASTGQKRGRGRPRKTQPEPEPQTSELDPEDDDIQVIDSPEAPPVKRPRGRPSKASKLAEAEAEAMTSAPNSAAKRGRPSKKLEIADETVLREEVVVEIEQVKPVSHTTRSRII